VHRDVLDFAPAALAHRMWEVAGTMRALAEAIEDSARAIDRSQMLKARSQRLQLITTAFRMRRDAARRS
jgi:hypothetical protein